MQYVGWAIWLVAAAMTIRNMFGIRKTKLLGRELSNLTMNITMLWSFGLIIPVFFNVSCFHLLWWFPLTFLLGSFSDSFPVSLNIPCKWFAKLCYLGLNKNLARENALCYRIIKEIDLMDNVPGIEHSWKQRTIEILETEIGPNNPSSARILVIIAEIYKFKKNPQKAHLFLTMALQIRETVFGADHPETATILDYLSFIDHQLGRSERAEAVLKRALEIREKSFGFAHPETVPSIKNLAAFYMSTGNYDEAIKILDRGIQSHKGCEKSKKNESPIWFQLSVIMLQAIARRDKAAAKQKSRSSLCKQLMTLSEEAFSLGHSFVELRERLNSEAGSVNSAFHYVDYEGFVTTAEDLRRQIEELQNKVSHLPQTEDHAESKLSNLLTTHIGSLDRTTELFHCKCCYLVNKSNSPFGGPNMLEWMELVRQEPLMFEECHSTGEALTQHYHSL